MVKRLPAMWETQVQSLGQEDLPEKEMATHSSILAWKIPWSEEPGRLYPCGRKESDTTERLHSLTQDNKVPRLFTVKKSRHSEVRWVHSHRGPGPSRSPDFQQALYLNPDRLSWQLYTNFLQFSLHVFSSLILSQLPSLIVNLLDSVF